MHDTLIQSYHRRLLGISLGYAAELSLVALLLWAEPSVGALPWIVLAACALVLPLVFLVWAWIALLRLSVYIVKLPPESLEASSIRVLRLRIEYGSVWCVVSILLLLAVLVLGAAVLYAQRGLVIR